MKMSFELPEPARQHFELYLRMELENKSRDQSLKVENRRLLGTYGEQAVVALVKAISPGSRVEDANRTIAKNNKGFDVLVDGWLRIQSKALCRCETMDMCLPDLDARAAWASDVWVVVDFGGLVDARTGRYADNAQMAPTGELEFYIAVTSELKRRAQELFRPGQRCKFRARKTSIGARVRKVHDYPEIFEYRSKFDPLKEMIASRL